MKKMVSILFHRAFIVGVFLVLQIALIAAMILRFNDYFVYFYWVCIFISVLVVFWIVGNQSNPAYKIAWIIPILVFPVFGGLFYVIFGGNRLSGRTRRKMAVIERHMAEALSPDFKADTLEHIGMDAVNQAYYLEHIAHCPVYQNTITEYYPLGDQCYPRMLRELRKAKSYIFIEYFIIEEGKVWNSVLEILAEKARAGLEVRVMYDDIGSMFTLPRQYAAQLEELGIQCSVFNPFVPVLSVRLNNRDHRKMCIIDGKIGFTGGINLADEYINEKVRYGHWKDNAIMLEGEAVWSMTVMFLSLWDYTRGVQDDFFRYRPESYPQLAGGGYVQPYADSPLDGESVGQTVYLNLINRAKRYLYITTPYLIIDDTMNTALCNAAKAGVDVRIVTPHVPDKKMVFELTRAHYDPLLEAGVRIYEYTPGFMHAKTFAVDDLYGTVGSVNMDYRSLYLHFENGVWLCDDPSVADIKRDFLETLERSEEMTRAAAARKTFFQGILRSVLRVFAPLM